MKDPANYEFNGFYIPARMAEGLMLWMEHGIVPGDFLSAVLRNDLREAVARADTENLRNLPAYVGYLHNEAPNGCWGSHEAVRSWHQQHIAALAARRKGTE